MLFRYYFLSSTKVAAQSADSVSIRSLDSLYAELDLIFGNEESSRIDLFKLVDSLLLAGDIRYHSLVPRAGFFGKVSSAGRDQDINQQGYATGLSYFHPSGAYADVSNVWNSNYSPSYYLTNASLGYMHTFFKKWNLNVHHDFYFYTDTLPSSFDKAIQIGNYLQLPWLDAGIDYAYLYGNENAHRLVLNVNYRHKWTINKLVKRISVMPGFSALAGNANVYSLSTK